MMTMVPTYGRAQIESLKQAGNMRMADNLAQNDGVGYKVTYADWMRTFFSNLWQVNKLKMGVGVPTTVVASAAIGLGGVTVPVFGWAITGLVSLFLLGLGVKWLIDSADAARNETNKQLNPTDSKEIDITTGKLKPPMVIASHEVPEEVPEFRYPKEQRQSGYSHMPDSTHENVGSSSFSTSSSSGSIPITSVPPDLLSVRQRSQTLIPEFAHAVLVEAEDQNAS